MHTKVMLLNIKNYAFPKYKSVSQYPPNTDICSPSLTQNKEFLALLNSLFKQEYFNQMLKFWQN